MRNRSDYLLSSWSLWRDRTALVLGTLAAGSLALVAIAALIQARTVPVMTLLIPLVSGLALVARYRFLRQGDLTLNALDPETRRHSRPSEWRALLAIETAQSHPERRLLLMREFRRLATEALAVSPTNRRGWPRVGRLAALHRQARLLRTSATDRSVTFLPETLPDDHLTAEALAQAISVLTSYPALLTAVRRAPNWDLEVARVLMRERNRLELMTEQVMSLVREG